MRIRWGEESSGQVTAGANITRGPIWRWIWPLVCIALVMPAPAAAAPQLYVGASAGLTEWQIAEEDEAELIADGIQVERRDGGTKAYVGLGLGDVFAIEVGTARLGQARLSAGSLAVALEGQARFIDVLLRKRVSTISETYGFVRAGMMRGTLTERWTSSGALFESARRSGNSVKFGFGIDYPLTPSLDVRGEWERYRFSVNAADESQDQDVDLVSIGLRFNF